MYTPSSYKIQKTVIEEILRWTQQIVPSRIITAILLMPLVSCSPTDYDSCVRDASTRPTELGVRLAQAQCHEKYKKPVEEAAAAARAKDAKNRASLWKTLHVDGITLADFIKVMGAPTYVLQPRSCTKSGEKRKTPPSCTVVEWPDKSGAVCVLTPETEGRISIDISCYFHAEFESADESAKLWAFWDKPF